MLKIKDVVIRNFRSYGDYETVFRVAGLGPTLILGEKEERKDQLQTSNGAGKTTLVDSLIWCLFGRVPSKARPGDAIINWFTGKDCIVKVTTCDGYIITRTRGVDGHDDLLIHNPNGEDVSLSTNPNCQKYLNRLFGLDYDIFMSSVFFAQFGTPFLDLPDQKRKKALERMLHLTKFDIFAEVAKEKVAFLTIEQDKTKTELGLLDQNVLRITQTIEESNDEHRIYEENRGVRIAEARTEFAGVDALFAERARVLDEKLATAGDQLAEIETYDLVKLEKEWKTYQLKADKLEETNKNITELTLVVTRLESERNALERHKDQVDPAAEIGALTEQLETARQELTEIQVYDVDELTTSWGKYEGIGKAVLEATQAIQTSHETKITCESELRLLVADIKKWEGKIGEVCSECRQTVGPDHIHNVNTDSTQRVTELSKQIGDAATETARLSGLKVKLEAKQTAIKPAVAMATAVQANKRHSSKLAEIARIEKAIGLVEQTRDRLITEATERRDRIAEVAGEIKKHTNAAVAAREKLASGREALANIRPTVTLSEAQAVKRQYDAKNQEIATIQSSIQSLGDQRTKAKEDIKDDIQQITKEVNPYQKQIDSTLASLKTAKEERAKVDKKVKMFDKLIVHFDYIRSAHGDRKKMKAHTLSTMIPYLNQRLAYYLDSLGSKFNIELNAFLQIKSKTWAYDQTSGGERMRINLAMMFAIYDLHTTIYQQQCNLLVLDEVDGRLDPAGVDDFVNLLYKEFIDNKTTERTILVISHREEMRDAFPTKLLVKKDGDYSKIEEVA